MGEAIGRQLLDWCPCCIYIINKKVFIPKKSKSLKFWEYDSIIHLGEDDENHKKRTIFKRVAFL
jgi:hypothetical protein